MRTSLAHIPLAKQPELQTIVQHILKQAAGEMIILFGSYARGNWVEEYADDGVHFQFMNKQKGNPPLQFDLLLRP